MVASGDFNKDGLSDLYWAKLDGYGSTNGTTNYIWLAKSDGTFTKSTVATENSIPSGHAVAASGDFNGDGLADFYSYAADAQRQATGDANDYVYINTGNGTFARTAQTYGITGSSFAEYRSLAAGDFNGDGISDIYVAKTRNQSWPQFESALGDYVFLGSPTGAFTNVSVTGPTDTSFYGYNVDASGDFNGDGLLDLYLVYQDDYGRKNGTGSDSVWLATRTSDGTVNFQVATPPSAASLPDDYRLASAGDFTGDGLTDLYIYKADVYGRSDGIEADYVYIARGDGTFSPVTLSGDGITGSSMARYKAVAGADFTGDGLADVFLGKVEGYGRITRASAVLLVSKGNGRFTNQAITVTGPLALGRYFTAAGVGDFNGDGLVDLYSYRSDQYQRALTNGWEDYLWRSSYAYPDLLTTITNGLSLASNVSYKALTDSTVYTRGSGAVYPATDAHCGAVCRFAGER